MLYSTSDEFTSDHSSWGSDFSHRRLRKGLQPDGSVKIVATVSVSPCVRAESWALQSAWTARVQSIRARDHFSDCTILVHSADTSHHLPAHRLILASHSFE